LFTAAIFRPNAEKETSAAQQAGAIYQQEMNRLDSMLVAYPAYLWIVTTPPEFAHTPIWHVS
jgi:hypothetical protein